MCVEGSVCATVWKSLLRSYCPSSAPEELHDDARFYIEHDACIKHVENLKNCPSLQSQYMMVCFYSIYSSVSFQNWQYIQFILGSLLTQLPLVKCLFSSWMSVDVLLSVGKGRPTVTCHSVHARVLYQNRHDSFKQQNMFEFLMGSGAHENNGLFFFFSSLPSYRCHLMFTFRCMILHFKHTITFMCKRTAWQPDPSWS